MAGELERAGRRCAAEVLARGPAAVAEDTWTAVTAALDRLRDPRAARLPDVEVACIVWGLVSPVVRDRALLLGLGPDARTAELLWTECGRRVPPPLDAVPLTLAAVAAWLRGDGATARIALTRARDSDPAYELAALLERALDDCLPPRRLRELIAGVGSRRW
jgi:hypothetical protein